jgi:hypothetical protein
MYYNAWMESALPYLRYVFLALGALPLVIYPGVLLANVMSLAAEGQSDTPMFLRVVATSFQVSSSAYPLVYGWCFRALKAKSVATGLWLSVAPLAYLVLVYGLFQLWMTLD